MINKNIIKKLKEDLDCVNMGLKDPNSTPDMIKHFRATRSILQKKLSKLESKNGTSPTIIKKKKKTTHKEKKSDTKTTQTPIDKFKKARELAKKRGINEESQSTISKIAIDLGVIAEAAISIIPDSKLKTKDQNSYTAAVKISESLENAFIKIQEILNPFLKKSDTVLSKEAERQLEPFKQLAREVNLMQRSK